MERWYFADKIGALANVQSGNNIRLAGPRLLDSQAWRETVLERLKQVAGDLPAFRVLAALAIADRQGLLSRDRNILSATGTGHLLAISGLHIGLAAHVLLTVPHHGSATSSSDALLATLQPSLALISAAANNRFGFPRPEVLQRYRNAGVQTLNTVQCGGIQIRAGADKTFVIRSARKQRKAI